MDSRAHRIDVARERIKEWSDVQLHQFVEKDADRRAYAEWRSWMLERNFGNDFDPEPTREDYEYRGAYLIVRLGATA